MGAPPSPTLKKDVSTDARTGNFPGWWVKMEKTEPLPGDEHWREFLTSGATDFEKRGRRIFGRLPANPRCKACNAPFKGVGAPLVRILLGKRQSTVDPRFCNHCTDFMREHPGGAEIEMTMLFADVRGSTALSETQTPMEFSRFINRFYRAATDVLLASDAIIDRLIGDEVVGIYVPGIAGPRHARRAVDAAQEILRATGHEDAGGPWIPVGAGVHTGVSYVGTVGSSSGALDFTALGDVPTVAARLASQAAAGEVIVSDAVCAAANLDTAAFESRRLALKGRAEPVAASILSVAPH
jgi:adenylate cyclase